MFEDLMYVDWKFAEWRNWSAVNLLDHKVKYFNLEGKAISRPSKNCWIFESGIIDSTNEFFTAAAPRRHYYAQRCVDGIIWPLFHKSEAL